MTKTNHAQFWSEAAAQEWAAEQSRLGRKVSRPWWDEVRKRWFVTYSVH